MKKCEIINGGVVACSSLDRHEDNEIIRYREIECRGNIDKTFYTLHDNISGEKGVVINFCPFCGSYIGFDR